MFQLQLQSFNKSRTTFHEFSFGGKKLSSQKVVRDKNPRQGVSVIELLVVAAIIITAFVGISGLIGFSIRISTFQEQTAQAAALAQETMEAVRNFRDGIDWDNDDASNLYDGLGLRTAGAPYHPMKSSDVPPKWQLVSGADTVNGFTRKVVFDNVLRNVATDDITTATSGSTYTDLDTKKATVTVSWTAWGSNHQVAVPAYFTNWK